MHRQARRNLFSILGIVALTLTLIGCQSFSPTETIENGSFSIIVLPDTQNYTDSSFDGKPQYFYDQTQWIKENKNRLNIVMVAHVGDIVQHPSSTPEWSIASKAFETIDAEVPYILCLGNHDILGGRETTSPIGHTYLNTYFPPSRFVENTLYKKNFGLDIDSHFLELGKCDNYYLYFEGGGEKFLILALEFKPRVETLSWANEVVSAHPDRRCIILTHGYLNAQGEHAIGSNSIVGSNPQQIWEGFVRQHQNILVVLCGHVLGEASITRTGAAGNRVHEILVDYQNEYIGDGGHGYLRVLTFYPDRKVIENRTYSPSFGDYLTRPKSQFLLKYE